MGFVIAYAIYKAFKYVMNYFEATKKFETQRCSNRLYVNTLATAYIAGSIRKAADDEGIKLDDEVAKIPEVESECKDIKDALKEKTKKELRFS
jgi:hypothetical protein